MGQIFDDVGKARLPGHLVYPLASVDEPPVIPHGISITDGEGELSFYKGSGATWI